MRCARLHSTIAYTIAIYDAVQNPHLRGSAVHKRENETRGDINKLTDFRPRPSVPSGPGVYVRWGMYDEACTGSVRDVRDV